MNNINKTTIISLVVINLMLSALCYYTFKNSHSRFDKSQTEESIKIKTLEDIFENTLNNDNSLISDTVNITDLDKNNLYLNDIIKNNPTFVLRISDLYCEECTRSILLKLMRLTQGTNFENNIIIFASYQNKRALSIYLDNLGVKYPVYITENLPLACEKLNYPYCFMINKNGTIFHTFIPDKNQNQISNNYLETIKNKYFKQ